MLEDMENDKIKIVPEKGKLIWKGRDKEDDIRKKLMGWRCSSLNWYIWGKGRKHKVPLNGGKELDYHAFKNMLFTKLNSIIERPVREKAKGVFKINDVIFFFHQVKSVYDKNDRTVISMEHGPIIIIDDDVQVVI